MVLTALLYFGLGAVLALVWACYTHYAAKNRAALAALWGGGIYALGCFSAISYVAHHWLAVPLGLGDVLGTYVTIKYLGKTNAAPEEVS